MRPMLPLPLVVGTFLATWPNGSAAPQLAPTAASCSTVGGMPRRIELADGSIVSVDMRSLAHSGGTIFAAGRQGFVFPHDVQAYAPPTRIDSIVGVLIDSRQRITAVRNPLAPKRIFHPRVVAGPNGLFHVLLATGLDSVKVSPTPDDTATLWYATVNRGRWSTPEEIGKFTGAWLVAEIASSLLERNGELSFTFPFSDHRSAQSEGGAIFLRRDRRGRWSADTLRTVNMPSALKMTFDRDGSIVVLVGLAEDIPGRSREKIHVARFDSTWTTPTYLVGDGVRPIANPTIARIPTGFVVSWIDWQYMYQPSSRLYWAMLDTSLRVMRQQWIDSGADTYPFDMVVVDDRYPMWLYHGQPVGEAVNLAIAVDTAVTRLAPLRAPFRSPIPSTLALSRNRFMVFTQITALKPDEPLAASYMTPLEIRCPRMVRR